MQSFKKQPTVKNPDFYKIKKPAQTEIFGLKKKREKRI
jgi:hypothetical protein